MALIVAVPEVVASRKVLGTVELMIESSCLSIQLPCGAVCSEGRTAITRHEATGNLRKHCEEEGIWLYLHFAHRLTTQPSGIVEQ